MALAGGRRDYGRPVIPDDFQDALRRRLLEIAGIALIACVATAALALATWSVNDPSLSFATDARVRNVLGVTGAVAADLAMQLFGIATLAIILPPAFWGWRLFTHRGLDRIGVRLAAWPLGLMAAAVFAATLTPPAQWPLPSGLGGVTGDAVISVVTLAGGPLRGAAQTVAALVFGTVTAMTTGAACGFGCHRRDDDDGPHLASLLLGFAVHAALNLKARVLRFVRAFAGIFGGGPAPEPRTEPVLRAEDAAAAADASERRRDRTKDGTRSGRRGSRRAGDGFQMPALTLLATPRPSERSTPSMDAIRETASALEHVLGDFGVRGEIINARPGPVVTLYELEPAPGIKSSRVIGLADDIARSMSALSARVAVVSGRNVIGIELPNPTRERVYLRELLASDDYTGTSAKLPLCLGKTIGGEPVIVDLTRMPHLLIAGTTGSGKSVAINTMILSLLYRLRPDECRLIMVDPKMLELSVYDGIPHLLTPVVTDPRKAVVALKWAVREMEDRYRKMAKLGVRNIDGYNARLREAHERGEGLSRMIHTGYDEQSGEAVYVKEEFDSEPLPYLVVLVDEMADLMMVAGKDIEGAIQRLAQMARAAGIHVVLATQRPSVDVITGTIKANFPTRISFQVTSKIDSRTILGEQGAEQLLGQGDMLYMAGGGRISRTHGPFVSDEEVEKVVRHLKSQGQPHYVDAVTAEDLDSDDGAFSLTAASGGGEGDLYQQAIEIVTRDRRATTSYLQRRLQIGYNRAASLIERMEQDGIIGQPNHAGKREILIDGGDD